MTAAISPLTLVQTSLAEDVPLDSLSAVRGLQEKLAADGEPVRRMVLKAAADCMHAFGAPGHPATWHAHFAAKSAVWTQHHAGLYDTVVRTCRLHDGLHKQAFADAAAAAGLAGKGIGYGALLGGAGLGSLYWLLSRHASQDAAEVEAMKQQEEYYRRLGHQLQGSLANEYRYDREHETRKRRPRTS